jgi:hypothetical protein
VFPAVGCTIFFFPKKLMKKGPSTVSG